MPDHAPILTLEPLLEAVQAGVCDAGWTLSGLQKTTSHQFEGRWEGEATRSAYLFFHLETGPEHVSIDVFLDETTRGLTGNLALVVDLVPLGELGDVQAVLDALAAIGSAELPDGHRTPTSLRLSLSDRAIEAGSAESQARFKIRIPRKTIHDGASHVRLLAEQSVHGFQRIMAADALQALTGEE